MSILRAVGAILASRSSNATTLRKAAETALGHPMTEAEADSINAALDALQKSPEAGISEAMAMFPGRIYPGRIYPMRRKTVAKRTAAKKTPAKKAPAKKVPAKKRPRKKP